MGEEKFDLVTVTERFQRAIENEADDVILNFYLLAFHEILKFFHLMGSIFGFVCSDVKSKVEILEEFLGNKEVGAKFCSVKKMIQYERESQLLNKKDYVSGCRTLLRLHRGLDFIRNFLRRLGEIQSNEKTNHVCSIAYQETLAPYHPFLIRKGATLAMYALPQRDQLLNKVCADAEQAILHLPEMLQLTDVVYNRVHALYTEYDILGLP